MQKESIKKPMVNLIYKNIDNPSGRKEQRKYLKNILIYPISIAFIVVGGYGIINNLITTWPPQWLSMIEYHLLLIRYDYVCIFLLGLFIIVIYKTKLYNHIIYCLYSILCIFLMIPKFLINFKIANPSLWELMPFFLVVCWIVWTVILIPRKE